MKTENDNEKEWAGFITLKLAHSLCARSNGLNFRKFKFRALAPFTSLQSRK